MRIQKVYDTRGRQTRVYDVSNTALSDYTYYTCCTVDYVKNMYGQETHYGYDRSKRVIKEWTNLSGQSETHPLVENTYDCFGAVSSDVSYSSAGVSRETAYTYDKNYRITRVDYVSPLGHEEAGYNSTDDVQWAKNGNGAVTLYRYDDMHRLLPLMVAVPFNYQQAAG